MGASFHTTDEDRKRGDVQEDTAPRFTSRFTIGIYGAVAGLALLIAPMRTVLYAWGIIFLLMVTALIFAGRNRQFFASVLGGFMFAFSAWNLYSQLKGGSAFSESLSNPAIASAILYFVVFGVPGAAYALYSKFGWRQNEPGLKKVSGTNGTTLTTPPTVGPDV